jgi:indolepyruvate ferredoxin oxidoreductase, beta subunit
MARLDRWFNKGRRLRTDSLRAFLTLHLIGGLRGWRRGPCAMRRKRRIWSAGWTRDGPCWRNYDLAVELIRCRRLIKGYSDTHARGLSKFDRVIEATKLLSPGGRTPPTGAAACAKRR